MKHILHISAAFVAGMIMTAFMITSFGTAQAGPSASLNGELCAEANTLITKVQCLGEVLRQAAKIGSDLAQMAGAQPVQPPAQPSQPAQPALGIKYQHDAGCLAAGANWGQYPACWVQRLQSGDETDISKVIVTIQELGRQAKAPSFEGKSLTLSNTQAAILWCSDGGSYPPDTARPLEGTKADKWKNNLVMIDRATGGADRVIVSSGYACYMIYRQ